MKKTLAILSAALLLFALAAGCSVEINVTLPEEENASGAAVPNDFSALAESYLEYIGTALPSRNVSMGSGEPSGESNHQAAAEWIVAELKKAGYADEQIVCETETAENPWMGAIPVQNIVLTVPGRDESRQVIAGAHYDGDGVGDNGSGTALLLAAAVGLADQTPLYTVKYVFFDAEEVGLVGAKLYAEQMTAEEIAATVYMINIDAVAFGDYCNLYGGEQGASGEMSGTEAYELAMAKAEALGFAAYGTGALGFAAYGTGALDGYYAENGRGPEPEAKAVYTNPWTEANPAPMNADYLSPSTGDWSDHADFKYLGIPYIYMEATNWFAEGDGGMDAYTGYFETADASLGYDGMFMNTEYDTLENLNAFFPGRALEHFGVFSPLLSSLLLNPASAAPAAE